MESTFQKLDLFSSSKATFSTLLLSPFVFFVRNKLFESICCLSHNRVVNVELPVTCGMLSSFGFKSGFLSNFEGV